MTEDFVITGAAVFDGEQLRGRLDVRVVRGVIAAVGGPRRPGDQVVDGTGGTLLPA